MITPKFLKHFGLMIRVAFKYYLIPFEWDPATDTFHQAGDSWKLFILKIQGILQLLRAILHGLSLAYDILHLGSESILGKILNFIWFFGHIWAWLVLANNSKDGRDISNFFTELKRLNSKVSGNNVIILSVVQYLFLRKLNFSIFRPTN